MATPQGIFLGIGLTVDAIEAIRDRAAADMAAGRVITSYSDGGTSVTKQLTASPGDLLAECRYALQRLAPEKYGKPKSRVGFSDRSSFRASR